MIQINFQGGTLICSEDVPDTIWATIESNSKNQEKFSQKIEFRSPAILQHLLDLVADEKVIHSFLYSFMSVYIIQHGNSCLLSIDQGCLQVTVSIVCSCTILTVLRNENTSK